MKKYLLIIFAILVFAIQNTYAQENTMPEQTVFELIKSCWASTGGITSYLTIVAIVLGIVIANKIQKQKDSKSKWRFLKTIAILFFFSQQAVAQNSTVVDTLKNNWIPILCIIGVLIVIAIVLLIVGICHVVKTSNNTYD